MELTYKTKGVCSQSIHIILDGDRVESVSFVGGCNGNTQGIGALVRGMKVDEVIEKLQGIRCGFKSTSCPAQLADALKQYKSQN